VQRSLQLKHAPVRANQQICLALGSKRSCKLYRKHILRVSLGLDTDEHNLFQRCEQHICEQHTLECMNGNLFQILFAILQQRMLVLSLQVCTWLNMFRIV
jgi:hypothetical protein